MPGGTAPRVSRQLESSLYVADLARSRAFYEQVFGFETLLVEERMAGLAVPGGSVLLLFRRGGSVDPSPTPGGTIPPHDGQGTLHLCFAVPLAELDAWERHLEGLGIVVESRVTQSFGGLSLYFRDPDGHSLEIAGPGLWAIY
jgi:catechol 2,3-dioxygenase-like lactoylglutathione lyase family enzyme